MFNWTRKHQEMTINEHKRIAINYVFNIILIIQTDVKDGKKGEYKHCKVKNKWIFKYLAICNIHLNCLLHPGVWAWPLSFWVSRSEMQIKNFHA